MSSLNRPFWILELVELPGEDVFPYAAMFRKLVDLDVIDRQCGSLSLQLRLHLHLHYRIYFWRLLARLRRELVNAGAERRRIARNCPDDCDSIGILRDAVRASYHLNRLRIAGLLNTLGLRRSARLLIEASALALESRLRQDAV